MAKSTGFILLLVCLLSSCKSLKNRSISSLSDEPPKSSVQILFLGDTGFGESYQRRNEERGKDNILKKYGYEHAFEKVQGILSYGDFTIANFETTINNLEHSPLDDLKNYIHQANPEVVPELLKKYRIEAVSLANNHTMDYGYEGIVQTQQYLDEKGINYFGSGENLSHASTPLVKEITIDEKKYNIYVLGWMSYRKSYREKYKFYANENKGGVNYWEEDRILDQIREIRREDSSAFIIAFPHWGSNYKWRSGKQQLQAHAIIDAGADVIIGHGAHMIQEIEKYRHKWICYNMGNFVFNSPGRYKKEGVAPYSFATLLDLKREKNNWQYHLKLFPLFSDNKLSNYQSYPLVGDDFLDMYELLLNKSSLKENTHNFIYPDTNDNIITLY